MGVAVAAGVAVLAGGSFVGAVLSVFDEHDVRTAMMVVTVAAAWTRAGGRFRAVVTASEAIWPAVSDYDRYPQAVELNAQ